MVSIRASKVWQELPSEVDKLPETGYPEREVYAGGGEADYKPSWGCWQQVLFT